MSVNRNCFVLMHPHGNRLSHSKNINVHRTIIPNLCLPCKLNCRDKYPQKKSSNVWHIHYTYNENVLMFDVHCGRQVNTIMDLFFITAQGVLTVTISSDQSKTSGKYKTSF